MKRVCVYLGSNPGFDEAYAEATKALARELAARNIGLVYGGSNVGLMGLIANTCLEVGGEVTGVIPELLVEKEVSHTGLSKLHVVKSMHERKQKMADLSDGFITLPGGIGTLEEFFETLTWSQLGYHTKPCGLLDVKGYYSYLAEHMDRMVQNGFLMQEHRAMALTDATPNGLLDQFETYDPPKVDKWIEKKKGL
ncbi:TIGR00730 family Rossman fold protein [Pseudodesulfovibrio sediminis]|uniref:Cytokinin riboside 5'-monophosphate phosphoribohydrolase n=1 Tax=Pseudodesulfovibrio sediminis TaxID=2810563 RepID=A0ABN6EYE7_9BACT|nr:TIGR00730 family Rossman fold protein [Pseudodesulfovibrio sediminis]BCS90071.1 cytokinin riboside 5'-monophosphate phosphoribohydrolase [Pseudodesulfovibrio sediminis]